MIQENLNLTVLHNISSIKEDNGVKVFYPFSQDVEIIRSIKKLNYSVSSCFYDDDFIKNLKNNSLIFNLCDGFENPEDEIKLIQALEKNKIPYTGCSSSTIKLCQNKYALKNVLISNKIKCSDGQLFKDINQKLDNINFPLILKPIGEDGSNGIEDDSIVFNHDQLIKKLSQLFLKFKKGVLAEEYIDGREFNVPIIGNETPNALSILEIDYSQHFEGKPKILTYKAKWSKNSIDFKNTYSKIAKLNSDEKEKIMSTAISAYKAANCSGYASVDLRMNDNGEVFVLDVNSNCYIAPESDMLKAALSINLSYDEILNEIIKCAVEKFSLQKELMIIK